MNKQALRIAPPDVDDIGKNLVSTLYVNRASSLHKLRLFMESLRDCNRALTISPAYAKAWYRRAKANASLGNYGDAINDLNVSLHAETTLNGKRQIKSEIDMLLEKPEQRRSEPEKPKVKNSDEPLQMALQCVSTPNKGRGMTSIVNLPETSFIHKEDPYAAIILKHCRETHCHFCFNELPADSVPCLACSIPLYCSVQCQVQAGGWVFPEHVTKHKFQENLSDDLEDYIEHVTSLEISSSKFEQESEHKHECQGAHWPSVLPTDVVLAGRVLVKSVQKQGYGCTNPEIHERLDLCENYGQLSSQIKLELHVYSVILLSCLQQFCASKFPLNSVVTSEIVILLSQIRINSMAITRVKHSDADQPRDYDLTTSMEQVRVAQAVYFRGSLFNHSCQPNVHAYFFSRTLFIRATEHVTAGSQLEISYGPQVGELDCYERHELLKDRYSFICQCNNCEKLNLSDLVINAYRCIKTNCYGVVLDSRVAEFEKEKLKHSKGLNYVQGYAIKDDDISRVAHRLFDSTGFNSCFEPGHCWSCGCYCDLQASLNTITEAEISIRRLQDAVSSCEIPTNLVMNALRSLDILRTVLHPWNKKIAEVEDNIARSLCLVGELQAAQQHCQASIEILERLYGKNHIAIGNELIKLASIQLSVGQSATADVNRLVAIFSRYYGSHLSCFHICSTLKEMILNK